MKLGSATEAPPPRLRRLVGDTGVYALATTASPITALLTVPMLTRRLGPAGFGRVDLLMTLTSLAGMTAMMGMDGAAARSWFEPGADRRQRRRVIATAVRAVAAGSSLVAFAVVLIVIGARLAGHPMGGQATVLAAFLTLPVITTQMMVREGFRLANRRAWYVGVAACAAVAGGILAVLFVLFSGLGASGYFIGLGCGALVALSVGVAGNPSVVGTALDRHELRIMLRFGLPLVPASISMWALLLADRAIVGGIRGIGEVGLYGLGSRVTTPLFLAVQAFQVAWTPFALRAHRDAPTHESSIRGRAATLALVGTSCAGIVLVAAAAPIVHILGGARFGHAAAAVLPLCVAWIAYAASAIGFIAFSIERRTIAVARTTAISAVAGVALSFALVPPFGFVGAAWATAASYALLGALALLVGQRISRARFEAARLTLVAVIAAAGLVGAAVADHHGAALAVRIGVCVTSIVPLIAVAAWPRHVERRR